MESHEASKWAALIQKEIDSHYKHIRQINDSASANHLMTGTSANDKTVLML